MGLLAEFETFIHKPQSVEQVTHVAAEKWAKEYDPQTVLHSLDQYLQLMSQPLDAAAQVQLKNLKRYFKELRKAGQYLRTSYFLFDEMHEPPEEFEEFVRQLGQLKDYFAIPGSSDLALSLKRIISKSPYLGIQPLIIANPQSITDAARSRVQQAENLLNKAEAQSQLPIEKLHKLRKRLRVFANVFTLAIEHDDSEMVTGLYATLNQINDDLGDIHDTVVDQVVTGQVTYEEEHVSIPSHVLSRIRAVLSGKPV